MSIEDNGLNPNIVFMGLYTLVLGIQVAIWVGPTLAFALFAKDGLLV